MLLEFLLFYETQRINLRVFNVHSALKKKCLHVSYKNTKYLPLPTGRKCGGSVPQ